MDQCLYCPSTKVYVAAACDCTPPCWLAVVCASCRSSYVAESAEE